MTVFEAINSLDSRKINAINLPAHLLRNWEVMLNDTAENEVEFGLDINYIHCVFR